MVTFPVNAGRVEGDSFEQRHLLQAWGESCLYEIFHPRL